MSRYPRRGRTVQTEGFSNGVAAVLWIVTVLACLGFLIWEWEPWHDLFLPQIDWLPWPL